MNITSAGGQISALQKTMTLDAARQRRKHQQSRKTLVISLCPALAIAFFVFPSMKTEQTLPETQALAIQPHQSPTKAPTYHTIESEEELLALLADQAPAIVTHKDGSRSVFLTNPQ